MSLDGLLLRYPMDVYEATMATNLRGAFLCSQAAVRGMLREKWGRVVNMSSAVALHGNAGQTVYAATKSGMNAIMGDLLMATWRHAEDTSSHETALMLDRILDAISTIFRSVKTRSNSVRPPATLHYDRAVRFIESHLSEVQLRPSRIASSLKISTGHLHAVMRSHGTSIGRLVMERRLDNSRRDLLHPELRSHTIAQIAMDWGFSDYAQFSKAFKRRFGVTPRAMRGTPGHLVSPGCS
jgi:AraC-like DNA-binding protein